MSTQVVIVYPTETQSFEERETRELPRPMAMGPETSVAARRYERESWLDNDLKFGMALGACLGGMAMLAAMTPLFYFLTN